MGCAYSFKSRNYESIYWIKTLKMAIFQPKMAQKWPKCLKFPLFLFWSNIIMPYEYPVNWDALILLYQGTKRGFIVSKTLKMTIFQPKMTLKWLLIAKIWRSQFSCIFQSHWHGILRFFLGIVFTEKFAYQYCMFWKFSKK